MLNEDKKAQQMQVICDENIMHFNHKADSFLSNVVTMDQSQKQLFNHDKK